MNPGTQKDDMHYGCCKSFWKQNTNFIVIQSWFIPPLYYQWKENTGI